MTRLLSGASTKNVLLRSYTSCTKYPEVPYATTITLLAKYWHSHSPNGPTDFRKGTNIIKTYSSSTFSFCQIYFAIKHETYGCICLSFSNFTLDSIFDTYYNISNQKSHSFTEIFLCREILVKKSYKFSISIRFLFFFIFCYCKKTYWAVVENNRDDLFLWISLFAIVFNENRRCSSEIGMRRVLWIFVVNKRGRRWMREKFLRGWI